MARCAHRTHPAPSRREEEDEALESERTQEGLLLLLSAARPAGGSRSMGVSGLGGADRRAIPNPMQSDDAVHAHVGLVEKQGLANPKAARGHWPPPFSSLRVEPPRAGAGGGAN